MELKVQNYNTNKSNPEGKLSKTADYIKELRNSNDSEVKVGGKNWDNNKKSFNKNYLRETTWNEGHGGASAKLVWPSPQNQVNSEEKFTRFPQDERRNYRCCKHGEPGHVQFNCTKK